MESCQPANGKSTVMHRPLLTATLGFGLAIGALSAPAPAQESTPASAGDVLSFPASFFAEAQPTTAYDMVQRLPGFMLDIGDADVRGLGGAQRRVLVHDCHGAAASEPSTPPRSS